jgi:hypothetical protein
MKTLPKRNSPVQDWYIVTMTLLTTGQAQDLFLVWHLIFAERNLYLDFEIPFEQVEFHVVKQFPLVISDNPLMLRSIPSHPSSDI